MEKIKENIVEMLQSYRLQHNYTEEMENMPLVDKLTPVGTITLGIDEIDYLMVTASYTSKSTDGPEMVTVEEIDFVKEWYKKWGHVIVVAVDFDGVLATFDKWEGPDVFGEPIQPMIDFINSLCLRSDKCFYINIFTTRLVTSKLIVWLDRHGVMYNSINDNSHNPPGCSHKPFYHVLIDDRAIGYKGQSLESIQADFDSIIKISTK